MKNIQNIIQSLLDEAVSSGEESGAQAAVYCQGELVVNAFAGVANTQTGAKVTEATLFPVFSVTKGMAATAVHLLAERGKVDYETPLAAFWPEFAKHGKARITVRHALTHTAGLPSIPLGIALQELNDWDRMCAALSDATPESAPGERVEYHAITFGWLVGEVVRRVDGRDFSCFLHEEICAPLGIETMFCGLPAALEARVAVLEEPNFAPVEIPAEPTPQSIPQWVRPLGEWMNRPEAHQACLPASSGIMNAHAIARHYAALLPGGVDGVELLPPARIEMARTRFSDESRYALGYQVGGYAANESSLQRAFGHSGHGGSFGFADPERGLAVGWTRNRFAEINTGSRIIEEIQAALKAQRQSTPTLAGR